MIRTAALTPRDYLKPRHLVCVRVSLSSKRFSLATSPSELVENPTPALRWSDGWVRQAPAEQEKPTVDEEFLSV